MNPVTVYSWADAKQPGITPMNWADCSESPEVAAANVIAKGTKAIFFWWPMFCGMNADGTFKTSFTLTSAADLVNYFKVGPDITYPLAWCTKFYGQLRKAKFIPERLILDNESIPDWWNTPATWIASLGDAIPPLPSDEHAKVLAFNDACFRVSTHAMQRAILVPLPWYPVPASNFWDMRQAFQLYDERGWEISNDQLAGESSPPLYLTPDQRHQNRAKPALWNVFIDCINRIHACIGECVPWIPYPSFAGNRWLWERVMRHAAAAGVRTFLYWNPTESTPAGDDAYAAAVFAQLKPGQTRYTLSEIQLDADSVTTGDEITTYEQFQKHLT